MLDLERVFQEHNRAVYRFCRSRLGNDVDAEDAVQEVFARAAQRTGELRDDVLPWLLTVARNICIDEQRRRVRHRSNLDDDDSSSLVEIAAAASFNPETIIIGRMRVEEMLGRLTPGERKAVRQKWLLDQTGKAAAAEIGITRGGASSILVRARKRLIAYLAEEGAAVGSVVVGVRAWLHQKKVRQQRQVDEGVPVLALRVALTGALVGAMVTSSGGQGTARPGSPSGRLGDQVSIRTPSRIGVGTASGPGASGPLPAAVVRRSAGAVSATPAARTVLSLIDPNHKAEARQVGVTDAEASPNFASDRTVLATGTDTRCSSGQCWTLLKSTDAGASWQQLPASGYTSTALLLPAETFGTGTFFAYGASGLQVTRDGGRSFGSAGPPLSGFASLVRLGGVAYPTVSAAAGVFQYLPDGTVRPLALLPANERAQGPALSDPLTSNGLLQVVLDTTNPLAPQDRLLSCVNLNCSVRSALPWAGPTYWSPSPRLAQDHTLALWSAFGAAVSVDGGQTLRAVAMAPGSQLWGLATVLTSSQLSMAALSGPSGTLDADAVTVSHDLGHTWTPGQRAPALAGARFSMLSSLGDSGLLAPLVTTDPNLPFGFGCSFDAGGSWRVC